MHATGFNFRLLRIQIFYLEYRSITITCSHTHTSTHTTTFMDITKMWIERKKLFLLNLAKLSLSLTLSVRKRVRVLQSFRLFVCVFMDDFNGYYKKTSLVSGYMNEWKYEWIWINECMHVETTNIPRDALTIPILIVDTCTNEQKDERWYNMLIAR